MNGFYIAGDDYFRRDRDARDISCTVHYFHIDDSVTLERAGTGRSAHARPPVVRADSHRRTARGREGRGEKIKAAGLRQTAEKAQPCSPEQCAELAAYI